VKLTLIHPCIGRHPGDTRYIRSWQMEPLAPALLAGLTPADVTIRFYDDRTETVPFDEPTDLVAMSIETYTAHRCYQIASEYRHRSVPVVMGGFHATLCSEEVSRYADVVVIGEAEAVWEELIDDFRHGTLRPVYRGNGRPSLAGVRCDRTIFRGKRYVPVTLVEAGRGCHFHCDFCAIQSYFDSTQVRRSIDDILAEIVEARTRKNFFFFVDDNITSNMREAKEFFRALIPLGIRWVSQASINAAHDEEFLDLISRSGCQGLLVGFESLDDATLRQMDKSFNTMRGGYEVALANLQRHHIRLYGTFVFGYDRDTPQTVSDTLAFALRHQLYMVAFNHLTPFPGTPLYHRLAANGQLLYDAWWMDPRYRYNTVPFRPARMEPEQLQQECLRARKQFYSLRRIAARFGNPVNRSNAFMARNYPLINLMLRREVRQRDHLPLGDAGWRGTLIPTDAAARNTRRFPSRVAV
jgi:radical SAM superfamily enzyme YgiQ (UPF0313 family)